MHLKESAAIIKPMLRTNEFFGLGPLRRPSDDPLNSRWIPARLVYDKLAKFIIQFWWFRRVCLLGVKYFLARGSVGSAFGDLVRSTVSTLGLLHVSWNRKKLNDALKRLDEFVHEESSALWLHRLAFRMNAGVWFYVISRLLIDIAAFYNENLIIAFIRSELFVEPAAIPASIYPMVLVYAFVDLILNRLITSAGLCLSTCTYVVLNFLMHIKFRKLNRDIRQCLRGRGKPAEIRKLRLIHADLCQIVIFMDDIFSPLAIIFHGGTVAGFCGETIRLIELYSKGVGTSESITFFSTMLSMVYLVTTVFMITISTAVVCDGPRKSIQAVNELLRDEETLDMMAGIQQVRLLQSQMSVKNVQMTAWRFYKLDRSALMTTYGASVSYVSLVVQSA